MTDGPPDTQQNLLTTDLPADVLIMLGRIVVVFGQLEYVLQLCTKRLSGFEFTIAMTEAEKLKSIGQLKSRVDELFQMEAMDQNREAEFGQILDRAEGLYRKRNDFIHALYTLDQRGMVIHQRRLDARYVDTAAIAALHQEVRDIVLTLNTITRPTRATNGDR